MLGGWLGQSWLVGAAGAIMLVGNTVVLLAGVRRRKTVAHPSVEFPIVTFELYSTIARGSDFYPKIDTPHGRLPVYAALAMCGEAGEFSEKVKKAWRDKHELDPMAALNELGDVLWYIDAACKDMGFTLADAASANVRKITSRRARGALKGSGDNR